MAEILIRAIDVEREQGPIKNRYEKGYPVYIAPDGQEWGRKEGLPNFAVIKVPDIPKGQLRKYRAEVKSNGKMRFRREWQLLIDELPEDVRTKLLTEGTIVVRATGRYRGEYDIKWQELKKFFVNVVTKEREAEDIE